MDVDDAPQMPSTINELHTEQFRQYVPPSYQYDVKVRLLLLGDGGRRCAEWLLLAFVGSQALLLAVLEVKPKDAELIAQTALTYGFCALFDVVRWRRRVNGPV